MEPIPMEWVEKLFSCMEMFYGERWTDSFDKAYSEDIAKAIWKSGLCGLTYEQIKFQLQRLKVQSKDPFARPPLVTEFYRYAKTGLDQPEVILINEKKGDPEIAKDHLGRIKKTLHG